MELAHILIQAVDNTADRVMWPRGAGEEDLLPEKNSALE